MTFCPLNRISAESVRYPADLGTDAQPLLGRLKFDGRFQKAVQQARPAHSMWQVLSTHGGMHMHM